MFLGRIVTKGTVENMPFFIEITDEVGDFSIPTLIIGKNRAIELFGKEKVHVLDRNIQENVSWTYAKNEKRVVFEEDVENFKQSVLKRVNSDVNYYFLNIFTEKLSFIKKFIKYMYESERKSVFVTSKHIYIYGGKSVIGLSLADFDYAGIDSDKILKKIKSNPENIVFTEDDLPENAVIVVKSNNIIIPYIHYMSR